MLTVDDICQFHDIVIKEYGGMAGVRDLALVESTLSSVYQPMDGKELVADELERAARLFYGLVEGHAFLDGNKRTALNALQYFINAKCYKLLADNDALQDLALKAATAKFKIEDIKAWLVEHTEKHC